MYGKRVFEIPVYRKDPEKLVADLDKIYVNEILRISPLSDVTNFKEHRSYQYFWKRQGNPYPYNQIVGWVVLWVRNDSILGEYYAVIGQRLTHACKKIPFEWLGRAFEVCILDDHTDETIRESIREEIQLLTTSGRFKNRWIDLEAFDNLAPYINWRKIVNESVL